MNADSAKWVRPTGNEVATVLAGWQKEYPACGVLALVPEALAGSIPALQEGCRETGIPLAGALFPALVTPEGLRTDGIWLLRMDTTPPTVLLENLSQETDPAAEIGAAVSALLPTGGNVARPLLFLVFDALVANIGTILDGLYLQLADSVRYAGVNAGSETFQPTPCLFNQDRCIGDGVLCLLLPSQAGALLEHGYPAPAEVMNATSTEGNRIDTIDWRPAFDTYRELIGRAYGVELTRENFYQYGCHFPFGILRADGEVIVRIPVVLTDEGSLLCVGEVPANATLVVLRAPDAEHCHCTTQLTNQLLATHGPLAARSLLTFYCAGRRMHMGPAAADGELRDLLGRSGAGQQMGALSLGEIGSNTEWGYPLFHNATLVCLPWEAA